jgi:ABC-2 type transport system ATP-binding protein
VSVIETRNLVKHYGPITALKGVSLRVQKGEIFGLLGQNGAGKTTLIKILLGLTRPSGGDAVLLGHPAGATRVSLQVGYLPEDHRFPDYHTGTSLLHFYGMMLEMRRPRRRQRIDELLTLVGLKGRGDSKIRTYSKGMKQRLGIAQALLQDPELIFFDEPTDGVDPVGRREIRDLMQQLRDRQKTIFVNSHLLSEVELTCDRVAILRKGEMVCEGTVASLTSRKGQFLVGLAPGQEFPAEELRQEGYPVEARGERWLVTLPEGQSIDPVVDWLRAKGLSLRHLVEHRQTLEELFLATVEGAEPGVDLRAAKAAERAAKALERGAGA